MSTLSEADLRAHIRWQLRTGALPFQEEQQKLYGGRGSGQRCDCCGCDIGIQDVLYEVEPPDHLPLAMHLHCFDAWAIESELRRAHLTSARKKSVAVNL